MKVGSVVLGLHIAALVAFGLTQGCVTTESQGSGRGAGAKHKGPWKHEHAAKKAAPQSYADTSPYGMDQQADAYEPVIIDSGTSSAAAPAAYGATAAAASSYDNTQIYVVQQGDVLSRIAVDFGTTTQTLIDLNNLSNPDVLYVGQELRVPAGSRKSSTSTKKSTPKIEKGGEYVIQSGDTLSGIAVAAGVSVADLRALNNIEDDKIYAGETLSIPSGGKVPTDTQKTTAKKADPVEPVSEPAPAPVADTAVVPVETESMQVDAVMDHVVYPGESLEDISRQYGVSKSDIMRLNNISEESAVKEGQRLRIPISE